MAAPKGNQFWRNRSKHGRDKLFATPTLLLEAAYEYFAWCDANPWKKIEQLKRPFEQKVGKSNRKKLITTTELPTQRPYTLSGLMLYCDASESWLRTFKVTCKDQDFLAVITHIEEVIATQQLEGATVGAFNANIIARKLGLTDKKDITTDGESLNKGYYDMLKARKTNKPKSE